eukprot:TRINITY_DN2831_c0_g1_i5.p1 TRINITY_DN2831_c0_g1~~TRINITY_DN2831_c0_g1_i5.p1  ORF type:complete len:175 (+),score=16.28 TRINITY_DN2831_c0_g1_i5:284-808(+)
MLFNDYCDVWEIVKGLDGGFTFDSLKNKMLKGKNIVQRRYDRIMIKSKKREWIASDIEIIGDKQFGYLVIDNSYFYNLIFYIFKNIFKFQISKRILLRKQSNDPTAEPLHLSDHFALISTFLFSNSIEHNSIPPFNQLKPLNNNSILNYLYFQNNIIQFLIIILIIIIILLFLF